MTHKQMTFIYIIYMGIIYYLLFFFKYYFYLSICLKKNKVLNNK